jgi:hypothetical protein
MHSASIFYSGGTAVKGLKTTHGALAQALGHGTTDSTSPKAA